MPRSRLLRDFCLPISMEALEDRLDVAVSEVQAAPADTVEQRLNPIVAAEVTVPAEQI